MGWKVEGLPDLTKNIERFTGSLDAMEDPAEMAAGEVIREAWEGLVPVKDRNYQRSLTVAQTGAGVAVGTAWLPDLPRNEQPVMYARPLEFGNSHQGAQPSARPALASSAGAATDAAGVELKSAVKGAARRRRKKA